MSACAGAVFHVVGIRLHEGIGGKLLLLCEVDHRHSHVRLELIGSHHRVLLHSLHPHDAAGLERVRLRHTHLAGHALELIGVRLLVCGHTRHNFVQLTYRIIFLHLLNWGLTHLLLLELRLSLWLRLQRSDELLLRLLLGLLLRL